jgi:hypothetical protein
MRDLLLWRWLHEGRFSAGEIVPPLKELATAPLSERLPFLGVLKPALTHETPEVRAAAVAVLRGTRGLTAFRQLVGALQDPEAAVRQTAVEALRESVAGHDWTRWVHVLFHPDPAVRQAAIGSDRAFPPPFLYKVYLLPDPVCSETIRQQLETAALPADALPTLFDFFKQGFLPGPLARRLAAQRSWDDWLHFLGNLLPRTKDLAVTIQVILQADWPGQQQPGVNYFPDQLDDVIHLCRDS